MEEMYFNEVSHNTNEEPGHEEYQSPVEQSSISTSDLIQKETHLLIEQNIKSNIHIQQLLSNISEATETIDSQRNEILNLQTKFEGITELYKLEISKREEVDEKISYMKRISEASLKELNTLLQRANDIEKDKAQLDTIITNYQERTECIGNVVQSITERSTKIIHDLEEELNLLKLKNEQNQATIQNDQMENENLKSKIQNLEENLEQLVKQLDENKKISDEQLENCKTKLAETETMLQEALNEKLKITTQFEEIEKNLAVQVENAAKLNETITQLKKENQDFNERNEKISSEIIKAKTMEKSLTEDLNNLQMRFNEVSNENKHSYQMLEEKIKIIEDKNLEISTNLLVINDLNNNLDTKDTFINELKIKTVHLQNEIDDLKSRIKNQQNIIDQKSTEFENMSKQLNNEIETEKLKIDTINKENMGLQQELSKYKEMHDTVIREYRDTLQMNETEFNKEIEDLKNKSNELKKDMTLKIDEKQKEIDKLQMEVNQMKTQIDEYAKEIKTLKENLDAANKAIIFNEKDIPTQSEDDFDSTPNNEIMHSTPKGNHGENSDTDSSQASFRFDTKVFSRRNNPFSQPFGTKRKNPLESPINKRLNTGNIFSIPDSSSGDKASKEIPKKVGNRVFRNTK